jgi:hypothetical protein
MRVQPLPWHFDARVAEAASRSPDLLDMGTGGERLSRLPALPARKVATEAWAPNVPIAARWLCPLGISVVHVDGAPDNASQEQIWSANGLRGRLPFRDQTFHLVTNRHESFLASEVVPILVPGGCFLTQQVALPWALLLIVPALIEGLFVIGLVRGLERLRFPGAVVRMSSGITAALITLPTVVSMGWSIALDSTGALPSALLTGLYSATVLPRRLARSSPRSEAVSQTKPKPR